MRKLSRETFIEISEFITKEGRPLEKWIYEDYFNKSCSDEIIQELRKYQNDDGGFGNGLEPDFRLPYSSAMASSIGFKHLTKIDNNPEAMDMIKKGIEYLEKTFSKERNGWFAVPKEVNDFPHTPWWHFNEEKGQCVIDNYWGNPSAELVGYLYKYREDVSSLDVDSLVDYAIEHLNNITEFKSFHEIYCYIRLYKILPKELASKLEEKITTAVNELVSTNQDEWSKQYVAKPLDFVTEPQYTLGIDNKLIEANLDYLVDFLEDNKKMLPSWEKKFYQDGMKNVWNEWLGVLSLNTLITLDNFSRIEK